MTQPLRYRIDGDGVPLLWIHGFPLSSRIFDPVMNIPGAKHVLIDLPGFGGTASDPAIVSIEDYAQRALATLDELKIDTAVIAGVSMGGYVALAMLRLAPQRVAALLLLDTRETADSDEARAQRTRSADRVRKEGHSFLVDEMLPKMLAADTFIRRPQAAELVRHAMEAASAEGIVVALEAMRDRPSSSEALRNFSGPVLIVVGAEDVLTPPSDSHRMKTLAAAAEVVVLPEAAHLSHLDQPALFRQAVEGFLQRVSGREGAPGSFMRNVLLVFAVTFSLLIGGCQDEDVTADNLQVRTIENTEFAPASIQPPPEVDTTETERKFSQTERIALAREGKMKDGQLLVESAPRISLPFAPPIAMDPVDGSKLSINAATPTYEYKGKIYYFSTSGNRAAFIADPDKYAKGALSRY